MNGASIKLEVILSYFSSLRKGVSLCNRRDDCTSTCIPPIKIFKLLIFCHETSYVYNVIIGSIIVVFFSNYIQHQLYGRCTNYRDGNASFDT